MKNKGKFTPQEILSFKVTQPPICPYCHDALIRVHHELSDGSGWLHGWTCDCETLDDYSKYARPEHPLVAHLKEVYHLGEDDPSNEEYQVNE